MQIWKCLYCGEKTVIEKENILHLQFGDRMAGGLFAYCHSPECKGELREIRPASSETIKMARNRYKKNHGIKVIGSTWDIGESIPLKL